MSDKPRYVLVDKYEIGGVPLSGRYPRETIEKIIRGDCPEIEVLVASYPRSGSARLLEIAWLLMNDFDTATAKEVLQVDRSIFLELCDPSFQTCVGMPVFRPCRLAKTHLPFPLVEKCVERDRVKVICGLRNPKDTLVSLSRFLCRAPSYSTADGTQKFEGSFSEFFDELFKKNQIFFGDIFDYMLSWWSEQHRDNILYVSYEDLSEDPAKEILKMASFLGVECSPEQLETILQWTSFSSMKESKTTNYSQMTARCGMMYPYMNKGTVGGWKDILSEEENMYIEELYKTKCLPQGLKFKFQ